MAENAISLNGPNGESRARFSRSVVPILLYHRAQTNQNDPKPSLAISGIVTFSGGGFCHIIANKGLLFPKSKDRYRYDVVFPNGTTVDLDNLDVESRGDLAAFYCPIENDIVDAVQFGSTLKNQELKMYLYEINKSRQLVKDVTDGYLTHVGQDYVAHDCPPSNLARHGAPVFNEQNQLVGISFEDAGVTKALGVPTITHLLSEFYEEMDNRPLPDILQHIKAVGEQKFAQGLL